MVSPNAGTVSSEGREGKRLNNCGAKTRVRGVSVSSGKRSYGSWLSRPRAKEPLKTNPQLKSGQDLSWSSRSQGYHCCGGRGKSTKADY